MLPFRTLKEAKNLKGKRVILHLDLNLPMENGIIENDFRLRRSLPTVEFLKKAGARIVIISHTDAAKYGLKDVARHMNKFSRVGFVPKVTGPLAHAAVSRLPEGGAVLLENVRVEKGEEENNMVFAKELASLGDIYVNDAFAVSHRKHASIMLLPKLLPSYAGFLFVDEYEHLSRALKPKKPFLLILGGAKFGTKLPLIKHYLPIAKNIFIGGALANPLFQLKGYEVGRSILGEYVSGLSVILKNKKVMLPVDVRLLSGALSSPDNLSPKDKMVDIGPKTVEELKKHISSAKSVLFNGPVGIYDEGFSWGTEETLKLLAMSKAETIVGGGDTLALVTKLKMEKKFTFVSTAGGAILDFLADGTLPGIEALRKNK